jgi:hypothetical protein
MLRKIVCVVIGLTLFTGGVRADNPKKEKTTKIKGKVKAINLKKKTVTVSVGGKEKTVEIASTTKFVGPRGGVSEDGLKDDRMTKGAEITVTLAANNKTARQIQFSVRKKEKKKDKK